jgi:hypothetical protein
MGDNRFLSKPEAANYTLMSAEDFLDFKSLRITAVDETKPWRPATKVEVVKQSGEVVEIDANTPFFEFQDLEGGSLTVSAAAAGHIDSLHIKGTDEGSRFDEPSLEALMKDASQRIPAGIARQPGVSAFDVEMGKGMGKEGIASMTELVEKGILSDSDVAAAAALKEEVYALNLNGGRADKESFVASHADGKVKFQLIRGDVLVPVVDAPKNPTTRLFMVFGPGADGKKTLYTAAPGRNMPRHPNPNQHKDAASGILNEKTFKESADAWFETVMLTGKG